MWIFKLSTACFLFFIWHIFESGQSVLRISVRNEQRRVSITFVFSSIVEHSVAFFRSLEIIIRCCSLRRFAVTRNTILVTQSATCIPSDIIPIEQTKERLLIDKQLTAVSRRGRCYQVTLTFLILSAVSRGSLSSWSFFLLFFHLCLSSFSRCDATFYSFFLFLFSSKKSSSIRDTCVWLIILDSTENDGSPMKNWLAREAQQSFEWHFAGEVGGVSSSWYAIMSKTVVRKTRSGNSEYRGNSKFPASVCTIHPPPTCDQHMLGGRPIHLRRSSVQEAKEVIDYKMECHMAERLLRSIHTVRPLMVVVLNVREHAVITVEIQLKAKLRSTMVSLTDWQDKG